MRLSESLQSKFSIMTVLMKLLELKTLLSSFENCQRVHQKLSIKISALFSVSLTVKLIFLGRQSSRSWPTLFSMFFAWKPEMPIPKLFTIRPRKSSSSFFTKDSMTNQLTVVPKYARCSLSLQRPMWCRGATIFN